MVKRVPEMLSSFSLDFQLRLPNQLTFRALTARETESGSAYL